ncbi:hypothetical protein LINPERPRIM_LOCUS40494 [Linum perenne]
MHVIKKCNAERETTEKQLSSTVKEVQQKQLLNFLNNALEANPVKETSVVDLNAEIKKKKRKELEEETDDEEEEDEDEDFEHLSGNPLYRLGKEKMGSSSSRGGRAEIPESMIIMTAAYLKLYQMDATLSCGKSRYPKLSFGWSQFAKGNALKIEDECVFQLVERVPVLVFEVVIVKVDLATTNVWSRLELKYSLPKHKNTSQRPTVGDDMSKEKYAELEKPVKEPKEAREKLSSNVAQMKKELEECKKKSWAILPSTKLLPLSLDTKDKYSYQPSISVFA